SVMPDLLTSSTLAVFSMVSAGAGRVVGVVVVSGGLVTAPPSGSVPRATARLATEPPCSCAVVMVCAGASQQRGRVRFQRMSGGRRQIARLLLGPWPWRYVVRRTCRSRYRGHDRRVSDGVQEAGR